MSAGSQHPQENQKREWGGVGGNRDIKGQKNCVYESERGEGKKGDGNGRKDEKGIARIHPVSLRAEFIRLRE